MPSSPETSATFSFEFSNLNVLGPSFPHGLLLSLNGFAEVCGAAGYDGVQWHPWRGTVSGMQLWSGLVSTEERQVITSLHQSFRGEKNLWQALRSSHPVLSVASWLLLSERLGSLSVLETIQNTLDLDPLPIVLYPEEPGELSGVYRNFGAKMSQPTPQVMSGWGVRTPDQLINEAYRRGYTGLCVDLFHLRAPEIKGVNFHPWQETLPALLPHTQQLHVSLGRIDMKKTVVDSMAELRDLLSAQPQSEIAQMLSLVAEVGWQGSVVVEVPVQALQTLNAGRSYSLSRLESDHEQIVQNIRLLLS